MLTLLSVSSSVSTALAQCHWQWCDLKTDIFSVVLEGWEVQARYYRVGPLPGALLLRHLPTRREGDKDASCLSHGGSKATAGPLLEALPPQAIVGG